MSSSRLSCWQIFLIKDSTVPRRCKADVENWKLTSQFAPCYLILKVELTLIKQRLPMKIHISSLRNWSVLRNWWAYISNWQQLPGLPNAVLSCFLSFETKAECQWPPMLVFSLLFFHTAEAYFSIPVCSKLRMAANSLSFLPMESEVNSPPLESGLVCDLLCPIECCRSNAV